MSWVSKGYRNGAIAELMSRDVKTVERHIASIYGKLPSGSGGCEDPDDRRVQAALMYLKASGQLQPSRD